MTGRTFLQDIEQQHSKRLIAALARPPRSTFTFKPHKLGRLLRFRSYTGGSGQEASTHPGTFSGQSRLPGYSVWPRSLRRSSCDCSDAECTGRRPFPWTYCVRRRIEERNRRADRGGREGEFLLAYYVASGGWIVCEAN
jgi:hypothetical protein